MKFSTISGGYLVPDDTHIGKWQKETDRLDHDQWLLSRVLPYIERGANVLDCGAFNGDHTIAYRRAVGIYGHVVAVETNPAIFGALQDNMRKFDWDEMAPSSCTCLLAALDETMQEEEDLRVKENANMGMAHLVRGGAGFKPISLTIDSISSMLGLAFNFIKLDIEGFEYYALLGANETLGITRPKLLIEINKVALDRLGVEAESIFEVLREHEYLWEPVQPDITPDSPQYDILAQPKELTPL